MQKVFSGAWYNNKIAQLYLYALQKKKKSIEENLGYCTCGIIFSTKTCQWAVVAQLAPPALTSTRWRERSLVQDPLGAFVTNKKNIHKKMNN